MSKVSGEWLLYLGAPTEPSPAGGRCGTRSDLALTYCTCDLGTETSKALT